MVTLSDYRKVYDGTDGWFKWEAAGIWDSLFDFQKRAGICGNLLEIGVWHGKSAALTLMHTDKKMEKRSSSTRTSRNVRPRRRSRAWRGGGARTSI